MYHHLPKIGLRQPRSQGSFGHLRLSEWRGTRLGLPPNKKISKGQKVNNHQPRRHGDYVFSSSEIIRKKRKALKLNLHWKRSSLQCVPSCMVVACPHSILKYFVFILINNKKNKHAIPDKQWITLISACGNAIRSNLARTKKLVSLLCYSRKCSPIKTNLYAWEYNWHQTVLRVVSLKRNKGLGNRQPLITNRRTVDMS